MRIDGTFYGTPPNELVRSCFHTTVGYAEAKRHLETSKSWQEAHRWEKQTHCMLNQALRKVLLLQLLHLKPTQNLYMVYNTQESGGKLQCFTTTVNNNSNNRDAFTKPCAFCKGEHVRSMSRNVKDSPQEESGVFEETWTLHRNDR